MFLDRADIEATNYPAEQDIRIAVVNRKTCGGGNRTAKGAQAQSILMSVLQSCRHKGIRVIDIVTSILRAPDNTPVPWSTQSGKQLRSAKAASRANYGVSVGHIPVRMIVMEDPGDFLPSGAANSEAASQEQIDEMARRIAEGLDQGAVAVGFGMAYTPAATLTELETMMSAAAERNASAHIHVRGGLEGLIEAIETAKKTGAPLHIVHANSSGGAETPQFLARIEEARAAGQDVTTECYPYSAGQTRIESALFDDWESWDDERFSHPSMGGHWRAVDARKFRSLPRARRFGDHPQPHRRDDAGGRRKRAHDDRERRRDLERPRPPERLGELIHACSANMCAKTKRSRSWTRCAK